MERKLVVLRGEDRRVENEFAPDVWNVIKLSNEVVPMIRTRETMLAMYLRAEMPENQHSGVVLTRKD